jgi:predicted N-acetyltransferase YhbS
MLTSRELRRDEIELVWNIDRRESIANIYELENGRLVLRPHNFEVPGWPPGEREKYGPILTNCFDRGGWFYGVFEDACPVGVAVLDTTFLGKTRTRLQLKFLHVDRSYRHRGLGKELFELAASVARQRGAKSLYVSATPSENTINFYHRRGCFVTPEPDPKLYELEPDDIHLECLV